MKVKFFIPLVFLILFLSGCTIPTRSEIKWEIDDKFDLDFSKIKPIEGPYNRISESQIGTRSSTIIIKNIPNKKIYHVPENESTHSMDPMMVRGSTLLLVEPEDKSDVYVGDMIWFDVVWNEKPKTITHRVIEIGNDEEGLFYRTQGINVPRKDPYKLRFRNIKYVLIGIIY